MIFTKAWADFRESNKTWCSTLGLVIVGIINTPSPNGAREGAAIGIQKRAKGKGHLIGAVILANLQWPGREGARGINVRPYSPTTLQFPDSGSY